MSISTIPEARLRQGFDYFDKDKSGTIEVTELSALFKWLDVDVAANNLSAKV
jgi:Ca2+-binding EF-hand superfamily protein